MSSVLVKGMEMPANCQNCFASDDECRFCRVAKKYIPMLGTPKFCPLVALPDKHGRLVDADAFKADYGMKDDCADCEKEMRGKTRACEYDRIYTKMDFCSWIDVADTIVEAEDGE